MSAAVKHTPGPWHSDDMRAGSWSVINKNDWTICSRLSTVGHMEQESYANARLISAAPTLADALKGLIGLCQIVRNRDDIPSEARRALTYNHRLIAAYEALSAAGIDGFQPSDFDAHKAA